MPPARDSMARLQERLATAPGNADDFNRLATLQFAAGNLDAAIETYAKCLTFDPRNPGTLNNLGVALIKARRFAEAVPILEEALRVRSPYPRALVNLGKALREVGRHGESLTRLREALAVQPDYVPALINLGDTLSAAADAAAACHTLERAVHLAPDNAEALTSLGIARQQSGRDADALATLAQAVALAPDHPDAHVNLAQALFCGGDWTGAWPHFEYRLQRPGARQALRTPPQLARWSGTPAPDREVCLIGEQGLGDQLQFVRYARTLRAAGIDTVVACEPCLVALLARSLPDCRIVAHGAPVDASTAGWMPLMSAPLWHGTAATTVPLAGGYLSADPARIEAWRRRLAGPAARTVALVWSGNPRMETGRYRGRSPPLAALAPLLRVPGVRFLSLQKGPGEEQLDAVPFGPSILRLPDLDAGSDAFLDTAAILGCVDLLVTSDTSIAHLAGAMGVPVWLCLMHDPDWRWMRTGERTPWYSSMRLYRQSRPGDWAEVYARIADDLAQLPAIA